MSVEARCPARATDKVAANDADTGLMLQAAMSAIARGDLTFRVAAAGSDICAVINIALAQLNGTLLAIAGTANAIQVECERLAELSHQRQIEPIALARIARNLAQDARELDALIGAFRLLNDAPPQEVDGDEKTSRLTAAIVEAASRV
jgi:hypothetical protein